MTSNQIPDSDISKCQMPSKPEQSINVKLKRRKKGKVVLKKQTGRPTASHKIQKANKNYKFNNFNFIHRKK